MGLTPAPFEAFPLAWIALVPLWLVTIDCSFRRGIFYALAWGSAYHGLAISWIGGIHPMTWLGVPWLASLAIAFFCWLFLTFWGAMLVVAWTLGMTSLRRSFPKKSADFSSQRLLGGVTLWCFLEAIWSWGPLWWTSLSYTQSPHNLIILQLSQLSGPTTVTAILVAFNGLIAEGILAFYRKKLSSSSPENKPFSQRLGAKASETPAILPLNNLKSPRTSSFLSLNFCASAAIILLLGSHALGWAMYARPLPLENPLKIGLIQGNIPNDIKLFADGYQRAMQRYTEGYKRLSARGVDAVLLPEGALPVFLDRLEDTPIYKAILNRSAIAWLGAYGRTHDRTTSLSYTNSLFGITPAGTVISRFDKIKLVPLGEYIPFESIFGKIVSRLSPLEAKMIAGKTTQIFETPFGKATVGICYESAFAEHFRRQTARGGEFILTASNNAHYAPTMPAQHHAQDVMRAIENDRWAARATNTGYSGIVDPRGRTLWKSDINTYEIHADTIYRRKTQTLYVRWGDRLIWVLGIVTGASFWFLRW